jgi:phosphoglycolate phosphatase-like HAD superfamily hydrolase/adenine/guanine phosphoribosyltransferase-like PRPP-binding protein
MILNAISSPRQSTVDYQVPMRISYDDVSITSVTSAVVCAERPNIKLVEATLRAVSESAPKKLREIIANIAILSTVLEREKFEIQLATNLSLWKRAADHKWSPGGDLTAALAENRLQSNVETSLAKGWLHNYVIQVRSLRHAHLRQIAKKGCDLHGNRHFASYRLPDGDPNTIGRWVAANEILEPIDWSAHASDLINNAEVLIRKSANNGHATVVVADYVKDWTQEKNSFNVFARAYTERLVEALKIAVVRKFRDLKISITVLPIQTLTTTDRTNATTIERLFRQPILKEEGVNFDGACVILADDHINTGACLAAMHSVVRKSGGTVIAISTYSRHEGVNSLRASGDLLSLFDGVASPERINDALSGIGIQFDTLTPREALTLAAALLDGRKKEQKSRFDAVCGANTLCSERPILPGIGDSVEELLLGAPRGIEVIKAEAIQYLNETRYMFRPVLFDLDDTLIDSADYYYRVYEHLFEIVEQRFRLPRPTIDYRQKGDQRSDTYFAQEYGQENVERIMAVREEILLGDEIVPTLLPDAEKILRYLYEQKIPVGIVSNTPQNILEHIVNSSVVKIGVDIAVVVGNAGKPNPEGLLKALNLLKRKGIDTCFTLYIGDDPDRDGEAASSAGLEAIIIPNKKVAGRKKFTTLPSLSATLAFLKTRKLRAEDIRSPPYIKRERRGGNLLENAQIITSEICVTEAPIEARLDFGAAFSLAQREFHNLRWIAKRGVNLRQEGPFSKEEQLAACDKVLHGFTASDGTKIEGFLQPLMIERLAEQVDRYVAGKWKTNAGANGDITIHLPSRTVIPKKKIENELAAATNIAIARRLSAYFRDRPIPNQNIEFCETDRVLIGEALQLVVDGEEKLEGTRICSLSGHDPNKTAQAGRTEGNGLSRIVRQPLFNYSTFCPGDAVILTDDCTQAGSTFITWGQALKRRGVDVVAYAALSSLPESRNLLATPEVIRGFDQAMAFAVSNQVEKSPGSDPIKVATEFQRSLDHLLRVVGLSKETLSNREALTVMAFFIDGTKHFQVEWFVNLASAVGADPNLPERYDESPFWQARRPFVSPNELAVMIDREVPKYCVFRV